jgi:hypothetical protein
LESQRVVAINDLPAPLAATLIKYRCAKLTKVLRRIQAARRLVPVLALFFLLVGSVLAQDKQTMPESNPSYQAETKTRDASSKGRIKPNVISTAVPSS